MTVQTMTVQLPVEMYERLKRRAEESHRSVNDQLVEMVATAMYEEEPPLPPDVDDALKQLAFLDDETLWRMVRTRQPEEEMERLEYLNSKQQREGLTDEEKEELDRLLFLYERRILVRAEIMALLKERGYDVSELIESS